MRGVDRIRGEELQFEELLPLLRLMQPHRRVVAGQGSMIASSNGTDVNDFGSFVDTRNQRFVRDDGLRTLIRTNHELARSLVAIRLLFEEIGDGLDDRLRGADDGINNHFRRGRRFALGGCWLTFDVVHSGGFGWASTVMFGSRLTNAGLERIPAVSLAALVKALGTELAIGTDEDRGIGIGMGGIEWAMLQTIHGAAAGIGLVFDAILVAVVT